MQYKERKSIYLQIADIMYEQILSGTWKAHERIPSIRETAVDMEVNPNTVTRTYTLLQEQGIIYNKRGIGYYTSPEAWERIRKHKKREFKEEVLPELFRTMDMLTISIDDIKQYYHQAHQRRIHETQ